MTLLIGLCTIAFLAVVVSGDHTTVCICVHACVYECVCLHGLMPGAQSLGLGATALVLHRSILAQSLAPCQSSAPLSCPGRDRELGLDGEGEKGDNLARRPTRFRFTVKEDWHQYNTNV